jgi:hypothetical protein
VSYRSDWIYESKRNAPKRPSQRESVVRWLIYTTAALAVAGLVLFVAVAAIGSYTAEETVVAEVTDKERVCEGGQNGGCQYLIFTDAGTFKLTDQLFLGFTRFDSSDVYGRIDPGETYEITSVGWRIPIFSQYPNIKTIEEVSE